MSKSTVGQRLKFLRELNKMTKIGLANASGISSSYLTMAEKEERVPSGDILLKIARYFEVSLDWLMTGEGEMYMTPQEAGEKAEPIRQKFAQSLRLTLQEVDDLVELVQNGEDTNYFRLLIQALKGNEAAKKELLIKLIKE